MLLALLAYTTRDWRQLQIAVAVPVFVALLLYPITPESPRCFSPLYQMATLISFPPAHLARWWYSFYIRLSSLMLTQVVGCCWKGLRVALNSTHGEQLEIHPWTMNISTLYKLQGCKIEWRSGTKFAAFHLLPNLESKTPILTSSSSSLHSAQPDI